MRARWRLLASATLLLAGWAAAQAQEDKTYRIVIKSYSDEG
jgi:hypothetical protein